MGVIDSKRIAKNTLFLYFRMGLTIIVNLYTVRVIWEVLGVDNYGIYNVVGGIVLMFQFLNNAMVASSQRFISYELGSGNIERLKNVFAISLRVHYILGVGIYLLGETIGLWFLNCRLNIPLDRMFAANCVYQCSLLAFFVSVISVPYNSCIVAHEHMKVYGYMSILDVVLRLIAVFLLVIIPFDKLISYAVLMLVVQIIIRLLYQVYCRIHYIECKYVRANDKGLMKDMFAFAGWSFVGNMGFSLRDPALNMILNIFFNVAMNAAKGIANQVTTALNGFTSSFTMALNPQIIKSYAVGDRDSMMQLVFRGCKFSFLLVCVLVIPIMVCCRELLEVWLGSVEPYTVGFINIMLIAVMVDSMVGPITTSLQAIGDIRKFQIVIAIIMLLCIPAAWIWLKIDAFPYAVVIVSLISSIVALIARLLLLREQIVFSLRDFLLTVVCRCYPSALVAYIICEWLKNTVSQYIINSQLLYLFGFIVVECFIVILIGLISLTSIERKKVFQMIFKRIKTA